MKKRFPAMILALALCMGLAVPALAAEDSPTAAEVYQAMIAMKNEYPEGMPWTNENSYQWKGNKNTGVAYGCAAFATMLSDAAFGDLPATNLYEFTFSDLRVGDILRLPGHTVAILELHDNFAVIAEGNYNSSIHWGRKLTAAEINSRGTTLITRYPEAPPHTFSDVPDWCSDAVSWAMYMKITNGTGASTFSPDEPCTNAMVLTFAWRANGKPTHNIPCPIPLTGNEYYADAVRWAFGILIDEDFDPNAPCTRLDALRYIWWVSSSALYVDDPGFSDIPDNLDRHAKFAIGWASEEGITNGYPDGTFRPNDTCTRGEIVTFLHRAYVKEARLTAE